MARKGPKDPGKLHSDHLEASREHAEWTRDLERWRASYEQALMDCGRRFAKGLKLANFEAALDRHEAAIAAHQEAIERHEKALGLDSGAQIGLSEDSLELHGLMKSRHDLSKASHAQLERTHRAVLEALELLRPG